MLHKFIVTIDDDDPEHTDIIVKDDGLNYDGPEDSCEDDYGVYHILAGSKEEAVEFAKFLHSHDIDYNKDESNVK